MTGVGVSDLEARPTGGDDPGGSANQRELSARWRAYLSAPRRNLLSELGFQIGAAAIAVVAILLILSCLSYNAGVSMRDIWTGSLATGTGLDQTLTQAMPLILTGAAVWFAFKVGMFNIGADGQLQMGGITAFVVVTHASGARGPVIVILGVIAGAVAGALWAFVAGWLRTARGASEVISTIMLNFIAAQLGTTLISGALEQKGATSPQTDTIPSSSQLGRIIGAVPVDWVFVVAVAVTFVLITVVSSRGLGLRLRAVGLNPAAAEHGGVAVKKLQLSAFVLSGAVSGVAGGLVVMGMRHFLAPGWAPQWGFEGILVAFLAMRVPALIPVWGLIFGMLATSAPLMKADASVPDGLIVVMQVLPVLALFLLRGAVRVVTLRRRS